MMLNYIIEVNFLFFCFWIGFQLNLNQSIHITKRIHLLPRNTHTYTHSHTKVTVVQVLSKFSTFINPSIFIQQWIKSMLTILWLR